jgi:8-oxo-dGTP diphosphatase
MQQKQQPRYTLYARILAFVLNDDSLLLIRRSPHATLFPNRYNGIGGHVERGEDVLSAARREVREETGLDVPNLNLRGILHVDEGADRPGVLVFVFVGRTQQREVVESHEGTLHWVSMHRLHELDLLPDLPRLLTRALEPSPDDAMPFFARSTISPGGGDWDVQFVA